MGRSPESPGAGGRAVHHRAGARAGEPLTSTGAGCGAFCAAATWRRSPLSRRTPSAPCLAGPSTADVVDAHAVLTAARRAATVLTSDPGDLQRLARRLPTSVPVRRI